MNTLQRRKAGAANHQRTQRQNFEQRDQEDLKGSWEP